MAITIKSLTKTKDAIDKLFESFKSKKLTMRGNLPVKNSKASVSRTYVSLAREVERTMNLEDPGDYFIVPVVPARVIGSSVITISQGIRMLCPQCGLVDIIDGEHIRQYRPTLSFNYAVKFSGCGHTFWVEEGVIKRPLEPKPLTTRKEVLDEIKKPE